jgi:[acyl-carrier-protein] S-malonyltransferase
MSALNTIYKDIQMEINDSAQPVAFLFAGQGNPVIGMGADIWDINAGTKNIWDCASDISGRDLRRLCQKGPMNRLVQTTVQQMAVTAINVTLFHLCREHFKNSPVVGACGHSVGEYSALYAAGAVSLETLFRMIDFRANTMNEVSQRNKGGMIAVKGLGYTDLRKLLNDAELEVDISCDNSRCQQVIGGTAAALNDGIRLLMKAGFEPVKLGVSGAWHTRLMAEGVPIMRSYLRDVDISRPNFDVLMNVTGLPEYSRAQIKENLSLHLTDTVKWSGSMERLLNNEPQPLFIEVSNKPYLGTMLNDFAGYKPGTAMHCRNFISI